MMLAAPAAKQCDYLLLLTAPAVVFLIGTGCAGKNNLKLSSNSPVHIQKFYYPGNSRLIPNCVISCPGRTEVCFKHTPSSSYLDINQMLLTVTGWNMCLMPLHNLVQVSVGYGYVQ